MSVNNFKIARTLRVSGRKSFTRNSESNAVTINRNQKLSADPENHLCGKSTMLLACFGDKAECIICADDGSDINVISSSL